MKFISTQTEFGLFMMRLKFLVLSFLMAVIPLQAAENIKAVGAVAKANVKAIGAVAEANIKAVGAVDNTAAAGCNTLKDQSPAAVTPTAFETRFNNYFASKFTAGATYTSCKVEILCNKLGTPAGTWTVSIYSDSSGSPGSIVGTASTAVNKTDFTADPGSDYEPFSGTLSAALTASTVYWVVIQQSTGGDASNQAQLFYDADGGAFVADGFKESSDGSSWSTVVNRTMLIKTYSN